MKKNDEGFTLIELLVVIAIIGLLSTLSVLALNSARARARDAKRIADIKQIQTALEMYYNDADTYPTSSMVVASGTIAYGGNVYMKSIPAAPTPADGTNCVGAANTYTYNVSSTSGIISSYTLTYCLGATINGIEGNKLQTATPAGIK